MKSDAKDGGGSASASPAAASLYYGFPADSLYDTSSLPDFDTDFLAPEDLDAFVQALATPDPLQLQPQSPVATMTGGATPVGALSKRNSVVWGTADGDGGAPPAPVPATSSGSAAATTPAASAAGPSLFISAKNDWAPVYERVVPPGGEQPDAGNTSSAAARWQGLVPRLASAFWPSRGGSSAAGGEGTTPTSASRRWRRDQKSPPQQQQQQQQRRKATAASTAAGKRARAKPGPGPGRRTQDETREGYLYGLLKWPFLLGVFGWLVGLSLAYLLTRLYVTAYEQLVTWRGRREQLRHRMRSTSRYEDWVAAAKDMDAYLGNDRWKEDNEFAFYDFRTVRRVTDQLRRSRVRAEAAEAAAEAAATAAAAEMNPDGSPPQQQQQQQRARGVEDLTALLEACVKNNFAGVENRHLYSRTYYGTKNLVQAFVDEKERSLAFLLQSRQMDAAAKRALFKRLYANYGRTALCLSGGASFAYYHFGVVKALLEADLLPDVITGTSGGALVAALVATRTNDELRQLLVPALAEHINACSEPLRVWLPRWWRTGARFDSVDWARQCAWWTRGSMTFREAYERTGRVLNVTCVPADPHSPTILCNYRTAPDCVIWSAVLASAAVPGILNPVVLMMKTRAGADGNGGSNGNGSNGSSSGSGSRLVPYAFGHKWKDGSLRTDIPLKALNRYFNVNFTVVSQVNPHVNLFFFSSRGSVGQPVTHRKGRGWRGGYLGSAFEEYLKQDLRKWLKLLRNLELLPRPLGQDWSQLWLQPFSGTITIWPQAVRPADVLLRILADPDPPRLARMLHEGQQSVFPPLKFISNRLRIERLLARGARGRGRAGDRDRDRGRRALRTDHSGRSNNNSLDSISDTELARLLRHGGKDGALGLVFASDDNATSSSDVDGLLRRRRFGEDGEAGGSGSDTGADTDTNEDDDGDDDDDDDGYDNDYGSYERERNVGTIPEEADVGGRVL